LEAVGGSSHRIWSSGRFTPCRVAGGGPARRRKFLTATNPCQDASSIGCPKRRWKADVELLGGGRIPTRGCESSRHRPPGFLRFFPLNAVEGHGRWKRRSSKVTFPGLSPGPRVPPTDGRDLEEQAPLRTSFLPAALRPNQHEFRKVGPGRDLRTLMALAFAGRPSSRPRRAPALGPVSGIRGGGPKATRAELFGAGSRPPAGRTWTGRGRRALPLREGSQKVFSTSNSPHGRKGLIGGMPKTPLALSASPKLQASCPGEGGGFQVFADQQSQKIRGW